MIFLLITAYLLLMAGFAPTKGYYDSVGALRLIPIALAWAISLGALCMPLSRVRGRFIRLPFCGGDRQRATTAALVLAVVVSGMLSVWYDVPIYLAGAASGHVLLSMRIAALICILGYGAAHGMGMPRLERWSHLPFRRLVTVFIRHKFVLLLAVAGLLRLFVIAYVPLPAIDVFFFLNDAPGKLLAGENPYASVFPNPYGLGPPAFVNTVYPYPPGALAFSFFPVLLFGDIRFGALLAQCLTAWIVYRICKDGRALPEHGELLAALALLIPNSLFVLEQAWIEPAVVASIACGVWWWTQKKETPALLMWGFAIAMKQIAAPLLLFIPFLHSRLRLKHAFLAGSVVMAALLPFIFWDGGALYHDIVTHHVQYDPPVYALTLNTAYKLATGENFPSWLVLGFTLLLAGLAVAYAVKRRGLSSIMQGYLVFLFGIFLLQQAFGSYYYFLSALLIVRCALAVRQEGGEGEAAAEPCSGALQLFAGAHEKDGGVKIVEPGIRAGGS